LNFLRTSFFYCIVLTLNVLLKYIGIFIFLAFLQVLVLNNITISNFGITPFFYILLIIILPFETPKWSLLIFAFFLGLFIDMFEDTGGVHAAATVAIAFIRPFILKIFSVRDGYSPESKPAISSYGLAWFLKYAIVLTIIHNIIYFLVLELSFQNFMLTLLKAILTSFFTISLIIISQYLVYRK